MNLRPALAIAAALVLVVVPAPVVAAVAGHPGAAAPAPPAGRLVTDAVPVPSGRPVTPLGSLTPLRLAFTLPFSNGSRLASLLSAVSNPASPDYRRFLSYPAVERDFGPSPSSVAEVEHALRTAGASFVVLAPGGFTVDATLPARAVESLFQVRLVEFEGSVGGSAFTAVGPPRLPSALLGKVVGIDGLASSGARPLDQASLALLSAPRPVPDAGATFVRGNESDGSDWFLGTDYAQAYEATELLPDNVSSVHGATYPTGVAIATLLASGYNESNSTTLPPWDPTVVDSYFNDTFPAGWPHPTVTGVPVPEPGVAAPPPPGPFHGQTDSTGLETENSLDLEMAGSLAPGSALYNFYFSGALIADPLTSGDAPQYLSDDLGAALSHNYSPAHLAVVSGSFGVVDLNESQWDDDLTIAAAMGVTIVAASGDQGDAPDSVTGRSSGQWPLWPATAAFNTTGALSVGGVSVALSGAPTADYTNPPLVARYDPSVQGDPSVSAWWDTEAGPGRYAGSEGGTSLTYAEPWWQYDSAAQWPIVNATETERFTQLGRAGPDVAFPANSTIAYVSATAAELVEFEVLGGTSVACPVFAGLLADVVSVENATRGHVTGLGFLDPELYRIASYYRANPGSTDPFWDVLTGSNAMFTAGPGWDAVTGWGGLSAPLFLTADENSTVDDYNYTGPTPGLPGPAAPATSLFTLVIVFGAAAAVVVTAAVLLANRRRRTVPGPGTVAPYLYPPNPPIYVSPPTGAFATFSCPYCGAERPAEPGHCPTCGAM